MTKAAEVARDVTAGWNRVKVSENLGATPVAPVAPVDTSLKYFIDCSLNELFMRWQIKIHL